MAERTLRVRIALETTALRAEAAAAAAAFQGIGNAAQASGARTAAGMNGAANSVTAGHRAAATAQNQLAANSVRASNAMGVGLTSAGARVRFGALSATSIIAFSAFEATRAILKIGMAYETNMNVLKATTHATDEQMVRASDTARQLGKDISIPGASASDAAVAMTTLAKGGFDVEQSMKAAKGSLQLAAAAGIDAGAAAEIESRALNTFALSAGQAGHVADLLANVSIAATGNMNDFALGLKQSGEVAHGAGISIDDTATTLGIFANAGLAGSDGGTSFRTMLMRLEAPSKRNQKGLDELGVAAWDASGKFVGMKSIMEQLQVAHGKMTDQQFTMAAAMAFGQDAVRAATVSAYAGAAGWDEMSKKMANGGGAAQLSAARMKGLAGAIENFKNQAQETGLAIYEKISPAVEGLVNAMSKIVSVVGPPFTFIFGVVGDLIGLLGGLPAPVLVAAVAFGAFKLLSGPGGPITMLSKAFQKLMWDIGVARVAATEAGTTMGGMGGAFAVAGERAKALGTALKGAFISSLPALAIMGVVAAIGFFTSKSDDAKAATDAWNGKVADLKTTLDKTTGSVTSLTRAQVINDVGSATLRSWTELGIDTNKAADAMMGVQGASAQTVGSIESLTTRAIEGSRGFTTYGDKIKTAGVSAKDLAAALLNNDFGSVNEKVKGLGLGFQQASDGALQMIDVATGRVIPAFGDISSKAAGLTGAYHQMNAETGAVAQSQKDFATDAEASAGAAVTATGSVGALTTKMGGFVPVVDDAAGVIGILGTKAAGATGGVNDVGGAVGTAASAAQVFKDNVDGSITALEKLQGITHSAAEGALNAADDVRAWGKGMLALPQAQREVASANDDVTKAQMKLNEITDKKISKDYTSAQKTLDLAEAHRTLEAAQERQKFATEGVDEATQKLAVINDKEVGYTTNLAQAAFNAARAQGDDLATATGKAEAAAKTHVDQLIAERTKMGDGQTQAEEYVKKLGLVPHDIATAVNLSTADAEQKLADYTRHMNELIALMQAHGTVASGATGGLGYTALGFHTSTGTILRADGGIVEAAQYSGTTPAAKGMVRESGIVNGGSNILWGEPETGWEAYVSGKPSQRERNRGVLREAASRLGIPGYDGDSASNYRPSMATTGVSMTQNVLPAQTAAPQVTVNPPPQDFTFRVFLDGAEVTSRVRVAIQENNSAQGRMLLGSL